MEQVVTTQSSSIDTVSKRMEQAVTTSASQEHLQTLSQDKMENVLTEATPLLLQDSKNKPADIVQASLTSGNISDVLNKYISQWKVYSQDQQLILSLILENSNIILQKLQDVTALKSQVDSIVQKIQSNSLPVQSTTIQQKAATVQSNSVAVQSKQSQQAQSVEPNDVQTWFQQSSVNIANQDSNPHSQTCQTIPSAEPVSNALNGNNNRTLKIFPAQPYIIDKKSDDVGNNEHVVHEKQMQHNLLENSKHGENASKPYVIHEASIDDIDGHKVATNSKPVISRPGELQPLKIISAQQQQDSSNSHQEPSGMQQQYGHYGNDSSYYNRPSNDSGYYNRGTSQYSNYYNQQGYSKGYGKGPAGYGNAPVRRYKRYKAGYGQRSNYYQDGANDYAEDDVYEDEDDDYDDNNAEDLQQDVRMVQQLKRGRITNQQSLPPAKYPRYL